MYQPGGAQQAPGSSEGTIDLYERVMLMETTHPFSFRGREGNASVRYRQNEDPDRWGYGLLELPWPSSLAVGLPVLEIDVSTALEGYGAVMGWIQVVRIEVAESSTSLVPGNEKAPPGNHTWVDVPPQLKGLGVPYVSFGRCPTLFDAPASTESDIRFVADSFLTASPDALISRRSHACFGLRWGYSTKLGQKPEFLQLTLLGRSDWEHAIPVLQEHFPDWSFEADWLS
jgi:hypothetical protein